MSCYGIYVSIYLSSVILSLTIIGNYACRRLFSIIQLSEDKAENDDQKLGRYIGGLERLIIGIGLMVQSWEVLVAIIALKTIARFKELDKKINAEYFLIGSMFSILWALLTTIIGIWFDMFFALGIGEFLQSNIIKSK